MFVRRGAKATVEADHRATQALCDRVAETGEAGLRVWYPQRQVAFGPRDAHAEGYEAARRVASEHGYPTVTRDVGGRAVVFTGGTLSLVWATPVDGPRGDIQTRYATATDRLQDAIAACGVETAVGEPADAFCPGTHSLQADGKLAGLAQRVTDDVAVVAGAVVVTDCGAFVETTAAVYDALDVPFDPDSTTSLVRAGGPEDLPRVADAVVAAVVA